MRSNVLVSVHIVGLCLEKCLGESLGFLSGFRKESSDSVSFSLIPHQFKASIIYMYLITYYSNLIAY